MEVKHLTDGAYIFIIHMIQSHYIIDKKKPLSGLPEQ